MSTSEFVSVIHAKRCKASCKSFVLPGKILLVYSLVDLRPQLVSPSLKNHFKGTKYHVRVLFLF